MILVGNQRGGARDLAAHLLKEENDHVVVHELRGFATLDLREALGEAHALSRGTRCRQYLFSLSLNPPGNANVPTEDFEAAIDRIEAQLGLVGQPRAIVFHEKKGRRHAHCVWSRIRADDMKAVQLSYTHNALMSIARELYIEHGWKMPLGLARSSARDPGNFTLEEWQQAKRQGKDPRAIKTALQDAWAISDTGPTLARALEERGFKLSRGDRKGFVAVDAHGEVYSLPRWIGLKAKDLRARVGDETQLASVAAARRQFAEELRPTILRLKGELLGDVTQENRRLRQQAADALLRHRQARQEFCERLEQRRWEEARQRQSRFRTGLKGLWDLVRGETARIRAINEAEARAAERRDRAELDALIFTQLAKRRRMDDLRSQIAREFALRGRDIRDDLRAYGDIGGMPDEPPSRKVRRGLAR